MQIFLGQNFAKNAEMSGELREGGRVTNAIRRMYGVHAWGIFVGIIIVGQMKLPKRYDCIQVR